jgi:hypothetical protein
MVDRDVLGGAGVVVAGGADLVVVGATLVGEVSTDGDDGVDSPTAVGVLAQPATPPMNSAAVAAASHPPTRRGRERPGVSGMRRSRNLVMSHPTREGDVSVAEPLLPGTGTS